MQKLAVSNKIRRALVFKTGQITSYVTGDDGNYQVGESHNYEVLTTGQHSGTTNITLNGKTEVKSNACVLDRASGLMWARTISASVGPASNGLLPYTSATESIFLYAAAANAALYAGYGNDPDPLKNWRVPTIFELYMQCNLEPPNGLPDATAFPAQWLNVASSTSLSNAPTTNYLYVAFGTGVVSNTAKTGTLSCPLVRGPL